MSKHQITAAKPKRPAPPKKPVPLWTWASGVTQSALTAFLACPEQFALNYVEGWTPTGFSVPLEFGTLFHSCIQAQGIEPFHPTTSFSPEKIAQEVCSKYEQVRRPQIKSPDGHDAIQKTLAAVEAVYPAYRNYFAKDDALQKWLAREQIFSVEHKFDDREPWAIALPQVRTINLRGMRDGEYCIPSSVPCIASGLGLFETKTKSQIDDQAIQSGLRADMQTMFYLYAMKLQYGEYPVEVLYNVVRRPGLIYNPSKETLAGYKDRIIEDIAKRPEWYFKRWQVQVSPSDIDTFVATTLNPILRAMYRWWESIKTHPFDRFKSPSHFRNLLALSTKYGKAPLYNLMILGRKREYSRRSSLFPELTASGPANAI
jgi:hypothetical protein